MVQKWDVLEGPFRALVFRDGVREVAKKIPMDRATVYRIINGETRRPCQAIRAGVERVLERSKPDE